jgi:hypothetical protein
MLGPEYHVKLTFVKDGTAPVSRQRIGKHLAPKASNNIDISCSFLVLSVRIFLEKKEFSHPPGGRSATNTEDALIH